MFKKKHLAKAHDFYEKNGSKTIVLARFVPIIRTFGPIAAGIAEMPYRTFLPISIGGGIGWISSMTLLGYFLGQSFPGIAKSVDKLVLVIIAISLLPVVIHFIKERKENRKSEEMANSSAATRLED